MYPCFSLHHFCCQFKQTNLTNSIKNCVKRIGYGDICPGNLTLYGKLFLVLFVLCGMGMFCGPVMDITSSWRTQVPHGSVIILSSVVLGLGVIIFTSIEGVSNTDALYASIITGTTIGYGDLTPKSNSGKIAVALYGVLGINVIAILLQPARDFFESFCHVKKQKSVSISTTKKTD
jgi:Ion channel